MGTGRQISQVMSDGSVRQVVLIDCDMCGKPTAETNYTWRFRSRWVKTVQLAYNVHICPLCCGRGEQAVRTFFRMRDFIDKSANIKCFGMWVPIDLFGPYPRSALLPGDQGVRRYIHDDVQFMMFEAKGCTCVSCTAGRLYDELFPSDVSGDDQVQDASESDPGGGGPEVPMGVHDLPGDNSPDGSDVPRLEDYGDHTETVRPRETFL